MFFKGIARLLCKLTTKEGWLQPSEPSIDIIFWLLFIGDVVACLGSFVMTIIALVDYASSEQWWFFCILLMVIVVPHVSINLFSFWWYRTDSPNRSVSWSSKEKHWLLLMLPSKKAMHWLLQALPLRMFQMGKLAYRTHQAQTRQNQADQDQAEQNQDQVDQNQDQTDQDQVDQNQADQNQTHQDQVDQDQAHQDQADQDQNQADQDQNQAHPDQADQNQTEQNQAEQNQTAQDQVDQDQTEQNQASQDQEDQNQTEQDPADLHDFHLAQADLSFLRLIAVYAGSAPQLVVRIYKMLKNWRADEIAWLDVLFGVLLAVALAINTGSLCRHSRAHRCDKQELSLASIILQILYRICFLASRVVALACLYNMGIRDAVITCLCISVVYFIWFIRMETNFTENAHQELFFRLLMSYLHLFGMFNVKDDRARYRYALYYTLNFLFELSVFAAYIVRTDDMLKLCALPCVFWVAGLFCHGVEHVFFHPGGRWYMERTPARSVRRELHCQECAAAEREAALKEIFVTANAS